MKKISVIGAGPGGLTCARILQQRGIAVTVYDRDPGPDARNQGGTLDLRTDDGQLALREAGLIDEFFRLARPEGQEMRQMTPSGEMLAHHVPAADELFKPEIDRGQLRDLLLDSLEPGTVRWGHTLKKVELPGRLHFSDEEGGETVDTDLIIGADGAFSRVRPAVSPAVPAYTGVSFQEAWFDDVARKHPEIAELVGGGSAAAADGDRGLFAQRNSGDHIRVYIIRRVPAGRPVTDAQLLEEYAAWSPRLRRLISDHDGPLIERPLFALPVPHDWETVPTVTLLGDAAHLMPPLGVGVNLAMLDAYELATAIAEHTTIEDAVRAYEKTMLPRSAEMQRMTEGGGEALLSGDLPGVGEEEKEGE
jgi:2-polyprenyl-6-methoxyphenol hydroxylase-like FAD-dependent oxidoreductase